jgi:hypothetical protein
MDKLINDRLHENLSRLKLTRAAEVLDTMVSKAEAEKSSYRPFWTTCSRRRWPPRISAASKRP